MADNRLTGLALLFIHRDVTISRDNIFKRLIQRNTAELDDITCEAASSCAQIDNILLYYCVCTKCTIIILLCM